MIHNFSILTITWYPTSFADGLRYFTILILSFLCGSNLAFVIKTIYLFPRKAIVFWRLFFLGKAIVSAYLVTDLAVHQGHELNWRTPVILVGALPSLTAMILLWINTPYKYYVIRPDLLSDEVKEEVIHELEKTDGKQGS